MTPSPSSGRVDKVIRLVAVSPESWEDAAQTAVAEAASSIRDLTSALVVKQDLTLADGKPLYRIRLQCAFRIDRARTDASGETVQVRRFLVVANQTLANAELTKLIESTLAGELAEIHVVVPQSAPSVLHADPATGLIGPGAHSMVTESREAAREEGRHRLATFREALGELGHAVSGEVLLTDPITAARTVLGRASFDEIIISTLPPGISRWLKLDLPSRMERAFNLPVTTLIQTDQD